MRFWILSKHRIESLESEEPEFLPDDLIETIQDKESVVVTDISILRKVRKIRKDLKFCYKFDGCQYRKGKVECLQKLK